MIYNIISKIIREMTSNLDRIIDLEGTVKILRGEMMDLRVELNDKMDKIISLIPSTAVPIPIDPKDDPPGAALAVNVNEFERSDYFIKIIGETDIHGDWSEIPPILTESGKVFRCPKQWSLVPQSEFENRDRKERDKLTPPLMEANCFWNAVDYLRMIQSLIEYNNKGGRNIPISWNGASWMRFCTNLKITEAKWRANITLKQLLLVIIYNFWNKDTLKESIAKLEKIKLGWYSAINTTTNFRTWKESLEIVLFYLDYSSEVVLQYIEPNISSAGGFFNDLKLIIKTRASVWTTWNQLYDAVEEVSDSYYKARDLFVDYRPPKVPKDPKISATKVLVPKEGFKCYVCDKKYVNKKDGELGPDEQNHGYAYEADGSGPCKCPMASANPEKCKSTQQFLKKRAEQRQKK